jgi:hypothetical protein
MKDHVNGRHPGGPVSRAGRHVSHPSRTARTVLLYAVDVVSGAACSVVRQPWSELRPTPVTARNDAHRARRV